MRYVLVTSLLLLSGSAMAQNSRADTFNPRSVPSFVSPETGMRFRVPSSDDGKTCLRRKSTRETECRTMDGWRKVAAKIDARKD